MNASVSVVIVKCELTYIQLEASITQAVLDAHACTAGSTNRCSDRSAPMISRAFPNACAARPSTTPRTIR